MAVIYISVPPGPYGGPSVFSAKFAGGARALGHKVIFDAPNRADVALGIVNVGKLYKKTRSNNTKLFLRVDGIYNALYNNLFNRPIRPDMTAHHKDLEVNIPRIDGTIYQSKFSRDCVFDEIVKCDKNYAVIANGSNPKTFKPLGDRKGDGWVNLLALGLMRDAYYMETLVSLYKELRCRGQKVKLILAGKLDGACMRVLKEKGDGGIVRVGAVPNNKTNSLYNTADIFLNVRMGCSCNQTTSEAQMAGLPIVVPSWGGDCESVRDGFSGIIAPSGKWNYGDASYIDSLADGVETIIGDLSGFKKRAREYAEEELTVESMVKKYMRAMGVD